jgi:DNA-binding beta-propeller fold protein YncE
LILPMWKAWIIFCGVLLLALLSGCTSGRKAEVVWAAPGVDRSWPEPPQEPRIRLLRTVSPADFAQSEGGKGKQLLRWITGEKAQLLPLAAPYGVAADGAGRIWVADTSQGVVHLFDLGRQRIEYLTVAGEEPLVMPVGVAYDAAAGILYVSDSQLKQVFAFDERGRVTGTRAPARGFGRPAGLAIDGRGNLYVVDVTERRVEVFSREGAHLRSIVSTRPQESGGETPTGVVGFNLPSNVALGRDGRVYVTDSMNFRIEMFDPEGNSLGTIGQIGDVPGTFARPRGVAVDSAGHVYVADAAFDNIQIFDSAGRLLLVFGKPGTAPGEFNLPAGLFFDAEDRLYVADAFNQRIQVFQYLGGAD